MKLKPNQNLSDQLVQMHNEKIAAMLTQAFTLQTALQSHQDPYTTQEVIHLYKENLDGLNKGEL